MAPTRKRKADNRLSTESDGDADNNCNAKRCKKYRSKLTSEQREVNKQKDRERKRCFNSVINKGSIPKMKSVTKRSSAAILKKKIANKARMRAMRAKMTADEIACARAKDKLRKSLKTDLNNTDINALQENDQTSETDRTYLANVKRKLKENLKYYKATNLSELYAKMIKEIKWQECNRCRTKSIGLHPKCYCYREESLKNTELMELGDVPPELMNLSTIEQLLIAKVHPVVQVYRLRGGQIGYAGHVINFFQDVKSFANILPHTLADISGVIKICCKTKSFHKDFNIRKEAVLDALMWLKVNNKHYTDIVINHEVLSSLPDKFESDTTDDLPIDISEEESDYKEDSQGTNITSSSIPQTNMHSAQDKIKYHLKWPELSKNPIDELGKVQYIVQAFPTLFPYGRGDISVVINRKFSAREYFQFLMDYKDKRFSSHKIFPYFAWNSVMRWECLTKGTVYMKKHPEFKKVNVNLLKALMKSTPDIGKDVMVYSSSIRSTKNFWYTRSSELQDMVHQIGLPTIFFTLSAADFHWPHLYDLLKEYSTKEELDETERHNLMFNHPKICSDYFFEVAEIFINQILIPHFNVKDHWYRFEWQLRGSPHVHGVLWFSGAIDVKGLQNQLNEVKDKVILYFDQFISCQNPNTNFVPTPEHPCRTRIEDVIDYENDLAALVNTVQRHTICSTKTCLKLDKKGNLVCKHKFPKNLTECSDIVMSDRKYFEFKGKRNDDRLNQFNEFMLVNWRGNHDITAVLSEGGFLHYIAKYAAKPEIKSNLFNDLFLTVINNCAGTSTVKSAVQRTLMSALVERDYSAQEVHHLLAGHKLYSSSRSFITLNLSITEWFYHMKLNVSEQFGDNCNNLLDSYSKRPSRLAKVNLMDFLRLFNTNTYRKKRGRPSVVRIFPRLDLSLRGKPDSNPAVARQLCMLFQPWESYTELPTSDEEWINLKIAKKLKYESLPYYKLKEESDYQYNFSDDDSDEAPEKTQDDWMQFQGECDTSIVSDLGKREIDQNYDWKSNRMSNEDEEYYYNFIKQQKLTFVKPVAIIPPDVTFNTEQNEILRFVDNLVEKFKDTGEFGELPKFLVCQANAGCGKTMVIQGIVHLVTEKCGEDYTCVIAPTAAAAVNAGGRTIHSNMRIYIGQEQKKLDLSGENLHNFQQEMKNVRFIIVEEFSMVGCRMFSLLNRRCMQMKNSSEFFGGCALLLFGDIKQLPPVGDESLCRTDPTGLKACSKDGYNLFKCVEEVKVLKKCHRQSDERFLNFLENIGHGIITEEDKLFIKCRFEEFLSPEDKFTFKDAIHLYMTRAGVQNHNDDKMREMDIPLLNIPAENNNAVAAACTDEVACNLQQNLCLGIGVRVMLRANLWTDAGLVNGAFGTVRNIVYSRNNETSVPNYILIEFDKYTGTVTKDGCVPIPRILRSWYLREHYCTRIQFPLDVGYATTYHKSQGLTIPKLVIHMEQKEKSPGMYYVSFSRVRNLNDIMILSPYETCHLFSINSQRYAERNKSEKWLLSKASGA